MAVTKIVEEVAEEVATNLEDVAVVTRGINPTAVGYFLVGVGVGVVGGFYFGYKFNREKIRAEAFKESEEEVDKIRETYQQKMMVAAPKPSVEELIEERGYSAKTSTSNPEFRRHLPAPVPMNLSPVVAPPPPVVLQRDKPKEAGWDYPSEVADRTKERPFVIHQDEFSQDEATYSKVAYTYYAIDDVLIDNEDSEPLPHADLIVGQDNLKFGHGSDDVDVVYVRNDRLEIDMEINRIARSYEEDVLGRSHNDST